MQVAKRREELTKELATVRQEINRLVTISHRIEGALALLSEMEKDNGEGKTEDGPAEDAAPEA